MNQEKQFPNMIRISSPEVLHFPDGKRQLSYGAQQRWYHSWIRRISGCGPTTCSNLLWYLAATRESCRALCDGNSGKKDMMKMMADVWHDVTPGIKGVDRISILEEGAKRYANRRGIALKTKILEVSAPLGQRPTETQLLSFLKEAIADDLPVAFLNLSNGEVRNLESWHWVALTAVNDNLHAEMYDQGIRDIIDMKCWLQTTEKGGGFVVLSCE